MAKLHKLTTRGFGAEPGSPDIARLSAWIAEHRGTLADITTFQLYQSLAPQLACGIDHPCAGGKFCADHIRSSLLGVKDRRKASLEIDNPIPTQVFGLFVRDTLQRILSLHHRNGVREALQIFRKTPLIRPAKKPLSECFRRIGGKVCVFCISCQFNHGSRSQHTIQMLVQENFGSAFQ